MSKRFVLIILLFGLAACAPISSQVTAPDTAVEESESLAGIESEPVVEAEQPGCTAVSGTEVITNEAGGFCVAYPEDYCLWQSGPETQTTLVGGPTVREDASKCEDPLLLHGSVVWVSINVEPANGRSLEQVVAAYSDGGDINLAEMGVEESEVMLGGEKAVQLDKAPGQDTQRLVFGLYNDMLYQLNFVPATDDYGERYKEMLDLYDLVMTSFQFVEK